MGAKNAHSRVKRLAGEAAKNVNSAHSLVGQGIGNFKIAPRWRVRGLPAGRHSGRGAEEFLVRRSTPATGADLPPLSNFPRNNHLQIMQRAECF
jgi:hypothetical protein